jgi:hypothetical protein
MAWDVQRYADHIGLRNTGIGREDWEEALLRIFRPVENAPCLEVMPCTITDRHRRLLLWYLPHILRPERQVGAPVPNAVRNSERGAEIYVRRSSTVGKCIENQY